MKNIFKFRNKKIRIRIKNQKVQNKIRKFLKFLYVVLVKNYYPLLIVLINNSKYIVDLINITRENGENYYKKDKIIR